MFEFAQPQILWLLVLIPVYLLYELWIKRRRVVRISYSRLDVIKIVTKRSSLLRFIPVALRTITLLLIVVALAQPRLKDRREIIHGEGLDIILSIDVSGSMQALDFKPVNRLEAAKKVALSFVERRVNDRIGVVVFAPVAYTLSPLTSDYNILRHTISNIEIPENSSGTAIGMGLATAVARLKDSEAENKVIILITDGLNNTGEIDPITAAHLAATFGIRVYAVGIGTDGLVDFPFQHPIYGTQYRRVKIDYDMETLHQIAEITGTGQAWKASDTAQFEQVIREIDSLETTEFEIEHYYRYREIFGLFLMISLLSLGLEYIYKVILSFVLINE